MSHTGANAQYITAIFYRQSSRELKRLDSILRSPVYAAFGEQVGNACDCVPANMWLTLKLAGLAVIRAFGKQEVFTKGLETIMDSWVVSGTHESRHDL